MIDEFIVVVIIGLGLVTIGIWGINLRDYLKNKKGAIEEIEQKTIELEEHIFERWLREVKQ